MWIDDLNTVDQPSIVTMRNSDLQTQSRRVQDPYFVEKAIQDAMIFSPTGVALSADQATDHYGFYRFIDELVVPNGQIREICQGLINISPTISDYSIRTISHKRSIFEHRDALLSKHSVMLIIPWDESTGEDGFQKAVRDSNSFFDPKSKSGHTSKFSIDKHFRNLETIFRSRGHLNTAGLNDEKKLRSDTIGGNLPSDSLDRFPDYYKEFILQNLSNACNWSDVIQAELGLSSLFSENGSETNILENEIRADFRMRTSLANAGRRMVHTRQTSTYANFGRRYFPFLYDEPKFSVKLPHEEIRRIKAIIAPWLNYARMEIGVPESRDFRWKIVKHLKEMGDPLRRSWFEEIRKLEQGRIDIDSTKTPALLVDIITGSEHPFRKDAIPMLQKSFAAGVIGAILTGVLVNWTVNDTVITGGIGALSTLGMLIFDEFRSAKLAEKRYLTDRIRASVKAELGERF